MINKKVSRILGPILGLMGFMFVVGVMEIPAFADTAESSGATYNAAAENKDYYVNINKSETQNGLKITVDKAEATKHRLRVEIKVESQTPFDKSRNKRSMLRVTYGENHYNGEGISYSYPDDKTLIMKVEQRMDAKEYPESGNLRVDFVYPYYKVNLGIDSSVDFSESFSNSTEKDISGKIPEFNFTFKKLESSALGTRIIYSEPEKDYSDNIEDFSRIASSSLIFKAGDKMYSTRIGGSYSTESDKDNGEIMASYESESATYDKIKNQNNMSVIPIFSDITDKDINEIKELSNEESDVNKESTNNVNYNKEFTFSDGGKGEISKIERTSNTVKVYCKGATEKESLLMAASMSGHYIINENKTDYENYDCDENKTFYKDPKDSLSYVVEFSNVKKDKVLELHFDSLIKQIDKFKVGDEIQLLK